MNEEHEHHGLADLFQYRTASLKRIYISLAITLVGMTAEIVGGILSGSLALLSDAGHMFTHMFALGISAFAIAIARKPRCHHRTFGLLRAEVLAAYTNAILLFGVTVYIVYEAVQRLLAPVDVQMTEMIVVATIGLIVNVISIALLHGHGRNISIRSAVAHMMADTISSVAIVLGALVMASTGWRWIDPVISMGIAVVILVWAWNLFRDTSRILMEVAPEHIDADAVTEFIKHEFPEVSKIDRVRIWSITDDVTSLTAAIHLQPRADSQQPEAQDNLETLSAKLKDHFGFTETTLEMIYPQ